ncbi:MAG: Iron-sulfur cluster assembly protein SufD [uncultured Nocardioidaceae bacterium]|uniref:Iron-sulfur cluster assembly protein SufD n=1 Tax=uncultured Nocardioidaceae bacterium TaxID=253824 RepID=A0A6J4LF57_9ACTN|nr:MAG: Iron-sulfur cluster assembly protein SufD [uncultured Nocardioidaceae bacterium]
MSVTQDSHDSQDSTDKPAVAGAVETSTKLASHLHPAGSFDLADHPVPNGREEVWRFTPLKRLRGLHDGTFTEGGKGSVEIDAPGEVTVERVGRDDPRLGTVYTPNDRVSAQAWQSFEQARVISVPAEAELERPILVNVTGEGTGPDATFHHLLVDVGAHARATVVVRHQGHAVRAGNTEIRVGDGANLTFVSVQDWDDDAVHLAHLHAEVGRDASYRQALVSIGGDLVRISSSVEYAGPGGEAELLGLYFADAGQHLEHRLFVDHNAPKTRSNVDYKGALQGQGAHSVWIGDVLIRQVAEGIETYESNRNLVLTDGCQADSVPNLEIETGEIEGAGHASTTGRFDDQQLFYLQSRGIDADEARRLVVHGFFADIIRRIGVTEIRDELMRTVEGELERSVGTPLASGGAR